MSGRWRQHALSIFFAAIFLLALLGQSIAGLAAYNEDQSAHGLAAVSYGAFITSSEFVVDVAENWQSEFLQFFLFILATIWLVQKGSPESKQPGDEGTGTDEEQLVGEHAKPNSPRWAKARGWRLFVYSNSLLLVMGIIFLFSWWAQSVAGTVAYNHEQLEHGESAVDWLGYVASADFWNRTLQNWQSEFLAVGSMVALSIYLRQRGSSESKPVGTPHEETAVESE
jgi:membrane protein implicated in regulation of membrane protease activity